MWSYTIEDSLYHKEKVVVIYHPKIDKIKMFERSIKKYWYRWDMENLNTFKELIKKYSKKLQTCLMVARDELIDLGLIDE